MISLAWLQKFKMYYIDVKPYGDGIIERALLFSVSSIRQISCLDIDKTRPILLTYNFSISICLI